MTETQKEFIKGWLVFILFILLLGVAGTSDQEQPPIPAKVGGR